MANPQVKIDPLSVLRYIKKEGKFSCQGNPGGKECLSFLQDDGWTELFVDMRRAKNAKQKILLCQSVCPAYASCIPAVTEIIIAKGLAAKQLSEEHRT